MACYLVMKNNLKRFYRRKTFFAITFLLPLLLCTLFGLVDFDKVSLRVGILEEESSSNSSALGEEGYRDILYQVLDRTEGITYATAKEESLNMDLMTGHFQVVLDCRGQNREDIQVLAYKPEKYMAFLQNAVVTAITTQEPLVLEGLKQKGLQETERSITMLLSLFLIYSILYASSLIRDKQTGTMFRYQFAKNNKAGYLGGAFGAVFIITLAQVLICMGLLSILSEEFEVSAIKVIVLAFVIAGFAALYSMMICYISKSEVQAGMLASAFSVLMSLLGGTFVAVEAMPRLLQIISYASPMRWIVELLHLL